MKHNENSCLVSLSKAKVGISGNHLEVDKSRLGIKRWGMVDFLVNYRGYVVTYKTVKTVKSVDITDDTPKKLVKFQKRQWN